MLKIYSGLDEPRLAQAASSMRAALKLLDEADAPPDIGAHLDLAIHRLESTISSVKEAHAPVQIVATPPSTRSK